MEQAESMASKVSDENKRLALSVMLAVSDVPTAVEWYGRALGAVELWSMGGVAALQIAGAPFLLGEPAGNGWDTPLKLGMASARVEVFCDSPDAKIRYNPVSSRNWATNRRLKLFCAYSAEKRK